jgi:hypothetical protein
MRLVLRIVAFCAVLIPAFLQAQSSLPPGTWRIADAPAELHDSIARADVIVVSMQDALLRELTDMLAEGGPAFAIRSCHIDVAWIIQRIGRQRGVAAGRTSDRLRNPANAPTQWAAPLVKANAGRQARDVDGFAVELGSSVGVLRPIAQRPVCASCHGPADRLEPAVAAELKQRYPADRATGFVDGEIRGWFWVEVPKRVRN